MEVFHKRFVKEQYLMKTLKKVENSTKKQSKTSIIKASVPTLTLHDLRGIVIILLKLYTFYFSL